MRYMENNELPQQPKDVAPAVSHRASDTRLGRPAFVSSPKPVVLLGSVVGIICWSIAGCACRMGLQRHPHHVFNITTYAAFLPNCMGCFLMGFVTTFAPTAQQDDPFPWIHCSIAAGFCGSLTTFSGWMYDMVRHGTAALSFAEFISGMTMPFVFMILGRDCSLMLPSWMRATSASGERLHIANVVFLALSVAVAAGILIGVEVAAYYERIDIDVNTRRAVLLAPLGAVLRHTLALLFNGMEYMRMFPMGTLSANLLAVLLVGLFARHRYPDESAWCIIIADGVSGSLSTVSSFVKEIIGLLAQARRAMAYMYALVTIALSLITIVLCPWFYA